LCGAFEFGYVEFLHRVHGLHRFGVLDQVEDVGGDDLPAKAELVL
jgi:hypothetical protein